MRNILYEKPYETTLAMLIANILVSVALWKNEVVMLRVVAALCFMATLMLVGALFALAISKGDPTIGFIAYTIQFILNACAILIAFVGNFAGMLAMTGLCFGAFILSKSPIWHVEKPSWMASKYTLPLIGLIIVLVSLLGVWKFWG